MFAMPALIKIKGGASMNLKEKSRLSDGSITGFFTGKWP
jgi:hypothetical protein